MIKIGESAYNRVRKIKKLNFWLTAPKGATPVNPAYYRVEEENTS